MKNKRGRLQLILLLLVTIIAIVGGGIIRRLQIELKEAELISLPPVQLVQMYASFRGTYDEGNSEGACNHSRLVVAHISDIHNDSVRFTRFMDFCDSHDIIDMVIITGDVVDYSYENADWFFSRVNTSSKPVLFNVGNHDVSPYENDTVSLTQVIYNNWYRRIVALQDRLSSNCYYFRDLCSIDGNKIRFVVINNYDYPEEERPDSTKSFNQCYYTTKQLKWLANVLRDSKKNNLPVVIISHVPPARTIPNDLPFYPSVTPREAGQWCYHYTGDPIGDMIDAFIQGKSVDQKYNSFGNELDEFKIEETFNGKGNFICYINGHLHGDYCGYSETHPGQLIINIGACKTGEWYTSKGVHRLYTDLPRSYDDETQDCWNAYIFDTQKKEVNIVRFGSHVTFDGRIRKTYTYKY